MSRFHIVTRPGEVTSGVAEFGAGRPTAAPEVRKAWHHVTGSRDLRSMGPGIAWPRGGGGGGGGGFSPWGPPSFPFLSLFFFIVGFSFDS